MFSGGGLKIGFLRPVTLFRGNILFGSKQVSTCIITTPPCDQFAYQKKSDNTINSRLAFTSYPLLYATAFNHLLRKEEMEE